MRRSHRPPRREVAPGTVLGGWRVLGPASPDPISNRTRVLAQCLSCGGCVERAPTTLDSAGCDACERRRRAMRRERAA